MSPSEEEMIASVPDALPLGIWVARAPGGEFVFANETFREIMGMEPVVSVGVGEYAGPYAIHRRDGGLYPEDEMPFVRSLLAGEEVMVDDIVIHRRDGRLINVRAYARPVFDGPGETMSHVVIAFLDITREVTADDARQASQRRIERMQRMESVGHLAGGVAHDFNNLLSAIRALAASLASAEPQPERREKLLTIESITVSAAALSQRLLDFAASGGGRRERVAMASIVDRVAHNLGPSLGSLHLDLDLEGEVPVVGDPPRLDQVVMNLVLNARDAGAERLAIRGRVSGGRAVLEFEDDGPGVPEAIRETIFEPYFSTKQGRVETRSGLGLATVFGVVSSHAGDVSVDSAPGGGALFRITLPAADS